MCVTHHASNAVAHVHVICKMILMIPDENLRWLCLSDVFKVMDETSEMPKYFELYKARHDRLRKLKNGEASVDQKPEEGAQSMAITADTPFTILAAPPLQSCMCLILVSLFFRGIWRSMLTAVHLLHCSDSADGNAC